MFHVKVCGVTTPGDAAIAAAAGADAIGLNFVPGSPRCLSVARAATVAEAAPGDVVVVGVFAGMPADVVLRIAAEVGLDAIQLHGHLDAEGGAGAVVDPPEICRALSAFPLIRAVRLDPEPERDPFASARRWIGRATDLGGRITMALVDAGPAAHASAAGLGGTGTTADWGRLSRATPLGVGVGLAGGLNPDNVEAAIRSTRVAAVDVASGVESAPGVKDGGRVRAFVAAARHAMGLSGP